MAEKEGFLVRWSRLKTENRDAPRPEETPVAAGSPTPEVATDPPPELPAAESLGFDSDFSAFLDKRVSGSLRRAALNRLFHSEHFNRMDGLDVYIDDYGVPDPIPDGMLEQLSHARDMLFGPAKREPTEEGEMEIVEPADAEQRGDAGGTEEDAAEPGSGQSGQKVE